MEDTRFVFGTVGSPRSTPKKPGGSPGAVIHTRELGLGALEVGWVRSVRVTDVTCDTIKLAADEHNVAISVHAPYFINLNANDEEWPKSRKRLMDAARCGNQAGATDIVFHPGSYFGRRADEVLQVAIPRLRECVSDLRAAGNHVTLRPETVGKGAMLGSLEDTLVMSKEILGVSPCIDIAHLHARTGDGSVNSYQEFASIMDALNSTLGIQSLRGMHIHISGIEYGHKGEKKHMPLDESDMNYQEFLQVLSDYECSGRILCESPIMEEDALLLQRTWGDITS